MEEAIIKAIGDPSRYKLLMFMAERAYCVRALARRSELSESAVSQHLKILREAGLVNGEKLGYYTHYRINKDALNSIINELESLCRTRRKPCDGPFYGCPESEYIRCPSYIPEKNRNEKEDK